MEYRAVHYTHIIHSVYLQNTCTQQIREATKTVLLRSTANTEACWVSVTVRCRTQRYSIIPL